MTKMTITNSKIFLFILVLYVIMSSLLINPDVTVSNDGPYYYVLAQSITSNLGYRDIFHPDKPLDVEYPPIYPLLLALVLSVFPKTIIGLKIVSLLSGIACLVAIYIFFNQYNTNLSDEKFSNTKGKLINYNLWLVVVVSTNLWFISFATTIAPEISYILFSVLTLIFLEKWSKKKDWFNKYLIFSVIGILITYYTKSIGLSLIVGSIVYLIIKKQYNKAVVLFICVSFAVLPWILRNRIMSGGQISQDYIGQFLIGNELNFINMIKLGIYNLSHYISAVFSLLYPAFFFGTSNFEGERSFSFLYSVMGMKNYFNPKSINIITYFVSFLFGAGVVFGFIKQLKNKRLLEIYMLCYLFLLFIFPKGYYLSSGNRYLLPIIPFIVYYFFEGISFFKINKSKRLNYNLVAIVSAVLIIVNLLPCLRAIKGNLAYLINYNFLAMEEKKDYHSFWEVDYFAPAEWIKKNTHPNSVIMHAFPPAFYIQAKRKTVFFMITPREPWSIDVNAEKIKSVSDNIKDMEVDYVVSGHRIEREVIDYLSRHSKFFDFVPLAIFKTEMKEIKIYKVVKSEPEIKMLDKKGVSYYNKRDYDQAIAVFNEIVLSKATPKAFFYLGQCYDRKGLYKKAIEMYKEAIRIEPAYRIAKIKLGIVEQLDKIEDDPKNPLFFEQLGDFYFQDLNVEEAIESLNHALRLNYVMPKAHYILGRVYLSCGIYDLAIEKFRESAKLAPALKYKAKHNIKLALIKSRK